MHIDLKLASLLLAAAIPLPAFAQDSAAPAPAAAQDAAVTATVARAAPPAQQAPAANGCELHIWPAERMTAITTGWLSGFGAIGGALDAGTHAGGDNARRTMMASALDSQAQNQALKSIDLVAELSLKPGTAIVVHDAPVDRKTMNKIKTRRAESASTCYSELIVADVMYQKAAIYGRSLRTLFMMRDFAGGPTVVREYKAWGGNGLKLFPPKPEEDATAALDELTTVFKKNFTEYAANERRSLTGTAH